MRAASHAIHQLTPGMLQNAGSGKVVVEDLPAGRPHSVVAVIGHWPLQMATDIGSPSPGAAAADAMILRCPHPYPRIIRTGDEKEPLETDGA